MSEKKHDFHTFLPPYLSDETKNALKEGFKAFVEDDDLTTRKIDYFTTGSSFLMQGDCLKDIPMYDYATNKIKTHANVAILSNTCDIDPNNLRDLPIDCVVAPILDLDKIEQMLISNGKPQSRVKQIIENFKRNIITNAFYLPLDGSSNGFIILFDKAFSLPMQFLKMENRFKSLSQIGFYFFLYSLSINFCRVHEKVDRNQL